eukprot:77274-Chlamydomonas_euryale.AAC.11
MKCLNAFRLDVGPGLATRFGSYSCKACSVASRHSAAMCNRDLELTMIVLRRAWLSVPHSWFAASYAGICKTQHRSTCNAAHHGIPDFWNHLSAEVTLHLDRLLASRIHSVRHLGQAASQRNKQTLSPSEIWIKSIRSSKTCIRSSYIDTRRQVSGYMTALPFAPSLFKCKPSASATTPRKGKRAGFARHRHTPMTASKLVAAWQAAAPLACLLPSQDRQAQLQHQQGCMHADVEISGRRASDHS